MAGTFWTWCSTPSGPFCRPTRPSWRPSTAVGWPRWAVANNPIGRYGAHLIDAGAFDGYLNLLMDSFNQQACDGMMCRRQLSVGWDGRVYDCDFNQALGLPVRREDGGDRTVFDYAADPALPLARPIRFRNHCYTCTAGSGSSCGGTIVQE